MNLTDIEVFKKEDPVKYYTMKFKNVPESFEEWKNIVTNLEGEGRFMIYRLWKLDEDPEIKALARQHGDVVVLEDLDPENPKLTAKDKISEISFTPKKHKDIKLYFSKDDCSDNLVFIVKNDKITQVLQLEDDDFSDMFCRRNK